MSTASASIGRLDGAVDGPQTVVDVDPLVDVNWSRLVTGRSTDVFQSPAWLTALSETYGFEPRAKLILAGDTPTAGVAYVDLEGFGRPRRRIIPFSDFCDPIAPDEVSWSVLSDHLRAGDRPVTIRCRRAKWPRLDESFEFRSRAAWHRADLTRETEMAWASLDPSARRAIRRASKEGVTVTQAEGLSDVRSFYELHLKVRRGKYGLLAQPFAFFEHLWDQFLSKGSGELLLAVSDDAVVGGVLFLDWGDTCYYKFNASDPEMLAVRPNDLVMWTGMQSAAERGRQWLDFGVSDLDQPGLIRYKEKYATETGYVDTMVCDTAVSAPASEQEAAGLLPALTQLLVQAGVPAEVTERGGELLYRYFA